MKQYIKTNRILLAVLALTVLVSITVIASRSRVERENKTYDIVTDYNELALLAEQSEHDIRWWLEQFRDMGITRVGLQEESLTTLMEGSSLAVTAAMMDTVLQNAFWQDEYPASFISAVEAFGYDRFDVVVAAHGSEASEFVTHAVEQRIAPELSLIVREGEDVYILLDGTVNDTLYLINNTYTDNYKKGFAERREIVSSRLMFLSLGLLPEKVAVIQDLGMEIVPRTVCYAGHNDTRFARAVVAGTYEKGILLCGTGIGISIAANKVNGARCALCSDCFSAEMSRAHNDANLLALGGRTIGPELAKRIVDLFLDTEFLGGRHGRRVGKYTEIEKRN